MAIDDIKDINKLRTMLKESQCEVKYLDECCKQAGLELAKNSYAYDYKEKNLVVQAVAVNEKLQAKEQEYEELRQYHNKCCKENAEKLEQWLEKYNQVSKDFYNGKYCNKENCNLLKTKEQECEELKFTIKHTGLLDLMNENVKLKQALGEIEKYFGNKDTSKTSLFNIFVIEQEILNIINKAKGK